MTTEPPRGTCRRFQNSQTETCNSQSLWPSAQTYPNPTHPITRADVCLNQPDNLRCQQVWTHGRRTLLRGLRQTPGDPRFPFREVLPVRGARFPRESLALIAATRLHTVFLECRR